MENDQNEDIITSENNDVELDLDEDTDEDQPEGKSDEDKKPKLTEEQVKAIKQRKFKKLARDLGIELPEAKKEEKAPSQPVQDLSPKDALLLAKANVDLEDVDEVVDFAKYRKIPIADALKNTTLKAILADKQEQRKTAQATNTGSGRKSAAPSAEALLDRARKGEWKEEDIDKLTEARMAARFKK